MKKSFSNFLACSFLSFLFLTSSIPTYAQNENGSLAPDFTLTDIEGNEYNLYDILDDGKMVVIDFMTTWCSPCWNFHESHILRTIYETHGPSGTDDIFVFMIESDEKTPVEALEGIGSETLGNWIEGTEYPIINLESDDFLYRYGVSAFPTVLTICPNKIINTYASWQEITVESIESKSDNCPYPTAELNAGIVHFSNSDLEGCGVLEFEPEILIQNTGISELNSVAIDYFINDNFEGTVNWQGAMKTYETESVALPLISLNQTSELKFEVTSVNGSEDQNESDNILIEEVNASLSVETDSLTIEILTDRLPEETYWAILNSNDEIVAEGGNVEMGFLNANDPDAPDDIPSDGNEYKEEKTIYTHDIVLPENGCYTFAIADWYGDGISGFAQGHYKISDKNGNEILYGDVGNFYRLDYPFKYSGLPVGVNDTEVHVGAKIFGNPVTEDLQLLIEVRDKTPIDVSIYDIMGKEVIRMGSENYFGKTSKSINTSHLNSGMYLLQISSPQFKRTLKFVKK